MKNFKNYTRYAAVYVGLFAILNSACAQEVAPRNAAASAPAAAKAQIPLTSELSELISGQYQLEHEHARVHWSVSHHGFSMFSAVFPMNSGTLELDASDITNSKLVANVDMSKVDTSIDAFDGRLNGENFFNTEKYPTSTFRSTQIVDNGNNNLVVSGELTFLGVTKPAVMNVTFRQAGHANSPPAGYRIGFDATMAVTRSEFGMRKSTIGDVVTLKIEAEFVPPQPAAEH